MNSEVMKAVSEGAVSGEVATRAIEGRNKLRMLDEEESELKAALVKLERAELGPREKDVLIGCLGVSIARGFEARRELVRRRMERVDTTE